MPRIWIIALGLGLVGCNDAPTPKKNIDDATLAAIQAKNATYDRHTFEVMDRALDGDATGIDVGSFKGDMLAKIVEYAPDGIHYAFEPLPEFHAQIVKRFPSPKIKVYQLALGDSTGMTTFMHVVSNPGYSGIKKRDYVQEEVVKPIQVKIDTLDHVVPADARVDFIKIDVEGAELQVLRGARETIRRTRPVIVFEHGKGASDRYGTTPEMIWALLVDDLGLNVSLMGRWLKNESPFDAAGFLAQSATDFYFIAYP